MNLDRLCDEAAAAGSGNPTSAITFNTATHSQTPKPDLQSLRGMSQDKNAAAEALSRCGG